MPSSPTRRYITDTDVDPDAPVRVKPRAARQKRFESHSQFRLYAVIANRISIERAPELASSGFRLPKRLQSETRYARGHTISPTSASAGPVPTRHSL